VGLALMLIPFIVNKRRKSLTQMSLKEGNFHDDDPMDAMAAVGLV
jgi:hypothetical protein